MALFPTVQAVGNVGQLVTVELRVADALTLLPAVVVEQTEGILTESDDGYEVAGCEQGHTDVDHVPRHIEGDKGTDHHHHTA